MATLNEVEVPMKLKLPNSLDDLVRLLKDVRRMERAKLEDQGLGLSVHLVGAGLRSSGAGF